MSNTVTYRPDIDGLRSLAVLSVLFYHFDFGIGGGYVGVDIFFVISGYLITSIIVREIAQDKFSFTNFMARRIRRIYPPMLIVLATCLVVGYLLLLPEDFESLAKSAMYQILFVSNIFFYFETGGYFGGRGEIMPLLHTWSLSVEEQFYLITPFLLVAAYRYSKSLVRTFTLIFLAASFLLSIYATKHYQTASFYILPTRAWELGLGALIPIFSIQQYIRTAKTAEIVSLCGLTMMLASIVFYTPDTLFPGLSALLPCAGAFLFIVSNSNHPTLVKRLFSIPILVGIGLISYSVYLWHWPLIAFANYTFMDTHNPFIKLFFLIASVLLGYLSWRYIEKFSRFVLFQKKSTVFMGWGFSSLTVVLVATTILLFNGYPNRFSEQVNNYALDYQNKPSSVRVTLQQASKNTFLPIGLNSDVNTSDFFVWGDSHAQALYPELSKMAEQSGLSGEAAIYPGVLPIQNFEPILRVSLGKDAIAWNNHVSDYIVKNNIKHVILIAAWERYLRDFDNFNELATKLDSTINILLENEVEVWILAQIPEYEYSVPRHLAYTYHMHSNIDDVRMDKSNYLNGKQFELFRSVSPSVKIIEVSSYFSVEGTSLLSPELNGESLYFDPNHISTTGAEVISPAFSGFMKSVIDGQQSKVRTGN